MSSAFDELQYTITANSDAAAAAGHVTRLPYALNDSLRRLRHGDVSALWDGRNRQGPPRNDEIQTALQTI